MHEHMFLRGSDIICIAHVASNNSDLVSVDLVFMNYLAFGPKRGEEGTEGEAQV